MPTLLTKPAVQGFLDPVHGGVYPTNYIDRTHGMIVGGTGEQYFTLFDIETGAVVTSQDAHAIAVYPNEQFAIQNAPDGTLWCYNSTGPTLELCQLDPTQSPWVLLNSWGAGGIPTGMSTLPYQFAWLQIGNGGWIASSDGTFTSAIEIFQANPGTIGFWGHSYAASSAEDAGICAGPQGVSSSTAYWIGGEGKLGSTTIQSSALTYDPATWPATNTGISSTTIKTYAPTDFDAAWSAITSMFGPAYDRTDGNVIAQVTGTGGGNAAYIVKLRVSDGSVLWKVPVANTSGFQGGIAQSQIAVGFFLYFDGAGTLHVINTGTGADTTSSITGALEFIHNQASDDVMGCIFGQAGWDNGSGGLILLNSTPTSSDTLAAVYFIESMAPSGSGGAIGYTRTWGNWNV